MRPRLRRRCVRLSLTAHRPRFAAVDFEASIAGLRRIKSYFFQKKINIKCNFSDHQEEEIGIDNNSKGIRLDLYIKDNKNFVYDIEIQSTDTKELENRARYYQSVIDVDSIKSREKYSALKENYIIFICMTDIFGEGRPVYKFQNLCLENKNLRLRDETFKIFFNAANCNKPNASEQKCFFSFLINGKAENGFTKDLKKITEEAKHNTQWRFQYMNCERPTLKQVLKRKTENC